MAYQSTLSAAQLTASEYLVSLGSEPSTRFMLNGSVLTINREMPGFSNCEDQFENSNGTRLAIDAESINLEKLSDLTGAIASHATVTGFRF